MGFPRWILGNKTEGTTVFLLLRHVFGELRTGLEQTNNGIDYVSYSQALKKIPCWPEAGVRVGRGTSPVRKQQ